MLKQNDVEIDKQSDAKAGQLEICEHLRVVNGSERLYGLHFDDHRAVDNQVEAIPGVQFFALVDHRERELPLHRDPSQRQLVSEAVFISRFQ